MDPTFWRSFYWKRGRFAHTQPVCWRNRRIRGIFVFWGSELWTRIKNWDKNFKTYSGWWPIQDLCNDTTLGPILSGRSVPLKQRSLRLSRLWVPRCRAFSSGTRSSPPPPPPPWSCPPSPPPSPTTQSGGSSPAGPSLSPGILTSERWRI